MKKRIVCFILIIAIVMSVSPVVFGKEADDSFNNYALVLNVLGFLDDSIYNRELTDFVTRGEFEAAISKIRNIELTDFSEEYITAEDAVNIAAYQFGYELFVGNENTEYGSYKRKLLSGVDISSSNVLTVETAVKILYNIINTPVMLKTGYGEIANFEIDDNKTPLTEYHDIYRKKGRVTANSITYIDNYEKTATGYIRINDEVYCAESSYADYIGYYVEFYYKSDIDTFENSVIYMTKTNSDDTVIIPASDIVSYDGLTYTYFENNKQRKITLPSVHTVILNGKKLEIYESNVYVPENGNVILIPNNIGEYDVVVIESFISIPLLSVTAGGTEEILFTERNTNRIFTIETDKKDCIFDLYIDGKLQPLEKFIWEHLGEQHETITLPQIPKYSVANVFADEYKDTGDFIVPSDDAKYIRIDITTKTAQGIVDEIGTENVTISGKEYSIADTNSLCREISGPKPGEKGIFMFDYDNKVTAWARDYINNNVLDYAYLINADIENGLDGKLMMKMLLSSGDIQIFKVKNNVMLNSKTEKNKTVVLNSLSNSAKLLDSTFNISQLIKFRTDENGEVCEIQTVLQDIGLPDGTDEEHLRREVERDKYYSRSDNGYSLYKYVGAWPNTAYYLKPGIIFSVPPTETFDDDDYNICYTWTPDYSGKIVDIFDINDYLQPQAVVAYEEEANSIYRPYVMVNKITTEIDRNGEAVALLRGYDGYDNMVFYSDELSMFAGLKEGDLVYLYGFGNKVTSKPQIIVSINYVKSFDYTNIPKNTVEVSSDCCLYELYSYEERSLTLQRGKIEDSGKREFQKGAYWTTNVGSLHYGAIVYDAECREGSRISSSPSTALMRPAINYGNESASKMFVYETSGICRLVVIYNGL